MPIRIPKPVELLKKTRRLAPLRLPEPIGVIAAVIPTTNPTSTAIFKTLLALKTRNGIMISPHPRQRAAPFTRHRSCWRRGKSRRPGGNYQLDRCSEPGDDQSLNERGRYYSGYRRPGMVKGGLFKRYARSGRRRGQYSGDYR